VADLVRVGEGWAELREVDDAALVAEFLASQAPSTRQAYARDVAQFAAWLREPGPAPAARKLLGSGPGPANRLVLAWRVGMSDRGLSPATVNRRVAALRSLVKFARTLGLVAWQLDVPRVKGESVRDTRGPRRATYLEALETASVRERALLRLLGDLGLRRAELRALDVASLAEREDGRLVVTVLGKGRRVRQLTAPHPTTEALRSWLRERGDAPGPLFPGRDVEGRVSGSALNRLAHRLVGRNVHALRHACLTRAAEVSGGDLLAVAKLAGHRSVAQSAVYVDAWKDVAGDLAQRMTEG
jgi:integrase/recombinase XerC